MYLHETRALDSDSRSYSSGLTAFLLDDILLMPACSNTLQNSLFQFPTSFFSFAKNVMFDEVTSQQPLTVTVVSTERKYRGENP